MHFFPSAKNFFLISHLRIGVNKCTIMDGYFLSRMVVHGAREVTSPFLLINLFLFRMIFWVFFFSFLAFFYSGGEQVVPSIRSDKSEKNRKGELGELE